MDIMIYSATLNIVVAKIWKQAVIVLIGITAQWNIMQPVKKRVKCSFISGLERDSVGVYPMNKTDIKQHV